MTVSARVQRLPRTLNIGSRLTLSLAVLVIPLFVLGYGYIRSRLELIETAQLECDRLDYLQAMHQFIHDAAAHRGLNNLYLHGSQAMLPRLRAAAAAVDLDLKQISALDGRLGAKLGVHEKTAAIRAAWSNFRPVARTVPAGDSFAIHTALIQSALDLNASILQGRNAVTAIPSRDSAIIGEAMLQGAEFEEQLAQLRGLAAGMLQKGDIRPEERLELAIRAARTGEHYATLQAALFKGYQQFPAMRPEVQPNVARTEESLTRFLRVVERMARGGGAGMGSEQLFGVGTQAVNQFNALETGLRESFDRIMDDTAAELKRDAWAAFALAGAGLAIALVIALASVRSVTVPLRKLMRVMDKVAHGEGARADVKGADEIGALARYFNAMVDKIERSNAELRAVERDRAQAALQESETRYSRLFLASPIPSYVFDLETLRILAVNDAAVGQFGYSREELIGMTADQLRPAEDVPRFLERRWQVPADGISQVGLLRHVHKSGREILCDVTVHHMQLEGRTASMAMALDVTERERMTRRLRDSEQRFRQLTENLEGVFWLTDLQKNAMLYVSPAYEAIWGRRCEDLYASPLSWLDAVHPDDRERVLQAAMTRQVSGEYDEQYRIVRPDGAMRWIRDRAFPIADDDGRTYRIAGVAQDITESKQYEQERSNRQALETLILALSSDLLGAAPEAIDDILQRLLREVAVFMDADRSFINLMEANGEYVALSYEWCAPGIPSKRVQCGRFAIRHAKTSWAELAAGRLVTHTTRLLGPEFARLRAMLEASGVRSSVSAPLVFQGQLIGAFGFESVRGETAWPAELLPLVRVLADIIANTLHRRDAMLEIRHLNEDLDRRVRERTHQLEAANSDLEAFSYSVSHDLSAPLRHIYFYASLVKDSPESTLGDADRQNLLGVLNSAKRMSELIQGLLDFSRLGRVAIRVLPVDMNALVADCMASLAFDASGRRVDWIVGDLPQVTGDPLLLRQVMANLLSNALKYSALRDEARIEIAALPAPAGVDESVFVVRDNGVGFDMKFAHKLFGMFQRLHSASDYAGHGIGLANVARIIQRHNGRVWAESAPDEGAAFFFSLSNRTNGQAEPAADPEDPALAGDTPPAPLAAGGW